jgi:hypothetical protein
MRRFLLVGTVFLIAGPLRAQKIVSRKPGQDQIVRVRTALNHLTVIQLAEPVESVAAGSQAFRVEWRGERVFVEPLEAGVSTNLFIWTKSGRQNYELEPAGLVDQMDFAIDGPAPKAVDPPSAKPAAKAAPPSDPMRGADEWMLGGTPVSQEHWKPARHTVRVMVRDLFRENGELYIRYSVENNTQKLYSPGTPRVFEVTTDASSNALLTHAYMQLDGSFARIPDAQTPLKVVRAELRAQDVPPGNQTVGVVGVKLRGSGPVVLKLDLADDLGCPVDAVFVI